MNSRGVIDFLHFAMYQLFPFHAAGVSRVPFGAQGSKAARQYGSVAAWQRGTSVVSFWRLFAATDVLQDISRRIFHYYCDRRCTMPSARCSAPSRCNVLPAALIFCFEMSAHNSASLLCDVCLLLYFIAVRLAANCKLWHKYPFRRAICWS